MKLNEVIEIGYNNGDSISFKVLDPIFFNGIYKYTLKSDEDIPNEIRKMVQDQWFPAVILLEPVTTSKISNQCYCYPKNLIKNILDMIGVDYDSHKEIFET